MPRRKPDTATQEEPQGLTPTELNSWLSIVGLVMKLPSAIDAQLQRDSDLNMTEYQVLAMLSEAEDRTRRMSDLAVSTNVSLSRLSHLVKRLEQSRYVRRAPDPSDGRFRIATLTNAGYRKLKSAAPAHVATVRSLVIDALSPERLRRLGQDAERIVERIHTIG